MAELTNEEIMKISQESGLLARTKKSITSQKLLIEEIKQIRLAGFATDDEEDAQGIFCVGAAFFDHFGRCAGAISATGVKTELSADQVQKLGKLVIKFADELTNAMRGRKDLRRKR